MKAAKNAPPKKTAAPKVTEWDNPTAVTAFIAATDHALKSDLEMVRAIILAADSHITEGIKWNAPSFYCHGWFATFNVRTQDSLMIVFHQGAKAKEQPPGGIAIEDKTGLLHWVAKDRAVIRFAAGEVAERKAALKSVVKQWVKFMA